MHFNLCQCEGDEQNALIVLRNERETRKAKMSLSFKEREILFSYLIQSHVMHFITPFCRLRGGSPKIRTVKSSTRSRRSFPVSL